MNIGAEDLEEIGVQQRRIGETLAGKFVITADKGFALPTSSP